LGPTEQSNAESDTGESRGNKPARDFTQQIPDISLPKPGSLRSIGEKITINPASGTSSFSIPVATLSYRGSVGLQLSYDSGRGNTSFGLGWDIGLPNISRKTSKRLPDYQGNDKYIISGAEELEIISRKTVGTVEVTTYLSRTLTNFGRIERHRNGSEVWWETLSPDNVKRWFGAYPNNNGNVIGPDQSAMIYDPEQPQNVFSWLVTEERDDRGNRTRYEYVEGEMFDPDPNHTWELNRATPAQKYIKRILSGFLPEDHPEDWFGEILFDYGEHTDPADPYLIAGPKLFRDDAFSAGKSGFDVHTGHICHRILQFNLMPDHKPGMVLNMATELTHDFSATGSKVHSITHRRYLWNGTEYEDDAPPPVTMGYINAKPDDQIRFIDADQIPGTPEGLSSGYRLADLERDGLQGVIHENGNQWVYRRNLGNGEFAPPKQIDHPVGWTSLNEGGQITSLESDGRTYLVSYGNLAGYAELGLDQKWEPFVQFPSNATMDLNAPNVRWLDLNGDNRPEPVLFNDETISFLTNEGRQGLTDYVERATGRDSSKSPTQIFQDDLEGIYIADFTGDGLSDVVLIQNGAISYWPNHGYGKFGRRVNMANAPVFDQPDQFDFARLRVADIDGSGIPDLLYLKGSQTRFWINQSGNSWSSEQSLTSVPPSHQMSDVGLMDLFGNGTSCLVWSSSSPADATAPWRYILLMTERDLAQVDVSTVPETMLTGIPLSSDGWADLSGVDENVVDNLEVNGAIITRAAKPYLLNRVRNGFGAENRIFYQPSTYFYLKDMKHGLDWVRTTPFPMHLVYRNEVIDYVSNVRFVSRYWYRHAYYDPIEKEMFGIAYVEQADCEGNAVSGELSYKQAPKLSKSWFHLGAWLDEPTISSQLASEYFPTAFELPDSLIEDESNLTVKEIREAKRALRGQPLRAEVYACEHLAHGQEMPVPKGNPYSVTQSRSRVRMLHEINSDREHAIFQTIGEESLTVVLEQNVDDPRISHQMTLEFDEYGQPLKSAQIAYGRMGVGHPAEQKQTHIVISESVIINETTHDNWLRIGVPAASLTWELGHPHNLDVSGLARPDQILSEFNNADAVDMAQNDIEDGDKRVLTVGAQLYRGDVDLGMNAIPLDLGDIQSKALPCRSYALVYTPNDVAAAEGKFVTQDFLDCKYLDPLQDSDHAGLTDFLSFLTNLPDTDTGHSGWWARDNETEISQSLFYAPVKAKDAWGAISEIDMDNMAIVPVAVRNALGHQVTSELDYRLLTPNKVTDPNGNIQLATFDVRGRPVQTAIVGKNGEGDQVDDRTSFSLNAVSTTFVEYQDFIALNDPAWVHTYSRETHLADLDAGLDSRWLEGRVYYDGFGREALAKAKATDNRWITSGRTLFNNKGNPVKQYEEYYTNTVLYGDGPQIHGVTPIIYYDPMDRAVATEMPDGTKTRTEFTPWDQESWDPMDCIGEDLARTSIDGVMKWGSDIILGQAVWQTSINPGHIGTPSKQFLDSLGRPFKTEVTNFNPNTSLTETYVSNVEIDIVGNVRKTIDAKGQIALEEWYDRAGRPIKSDSNDAGKSFVVSAMDGQPRIAYQSNGYRVEQDYDVLRRPTKFWVTELDGTTYLREAIVYAEDPNFPGDNGIGQPWRVMDPCGVVESGSFDFKGLPLSTTRHVLGSLMNANSPPPDKTNWQAVTLNAPLQNIAESFMTSALVDALGRPATSTGPDGSQQHFSYDEAGALQTVKLSGVPGDPVMRDIVMDIQYDSKGRRESIDYGNNTRTEYNYDAHTYRLINIISSRGNSDVLQELHYHYDPLGNILKIEDQAQDPVFTNNQLILPEKTYVYDSLSRLVEARGREHITQSKPDQSRFIEGLTLPGARDAGGLSRYTERWLYDQIGNIQHWDHSNPAPSAPTWSRNYEYGVIGTNRLTKTSVTQGSNPTVDTIYQHDVAGNIFEFGHLTESDWNVDDQPERMVLHGNKIAHYRYDASGERFYKRVAVKNGAGQWVTQSIRLYLGGFEIYREFDAAGEATKRRDSLHVMDGQSRVLLIETEKQDDDILVADDPIDRWQMSDHLGSAGIELDNSGIIISYEEYHAYGTTSWHWSSDDISQKRYRYTGMERDKESGLQYHSARYYLPWIGRWLSADPLRRYIRSNVDFSKMIKFAKSRKKVTSSQLHSKPLFQYCQQNPISRKDQGGMQSRSHRHNPRKFSKRKYTKGRFRDNVKGIFNSIGRGIKDAFNFTRKGISKGAKSVWEGIKNGISSIGKTIADRWLQPWGKLDINILGFRIVSRQHRQSTRRWFPFHIERSKQRNKRRISPFRWGDNVRLNLGLRIGNYVIFNISLGYDAVQEDFFPRDGANVVPRRLQNSSGTNYIGGFYRVTTPAARSSSYGVIGTKNLMSHHELTGVATVVAFLLTFFISLSLLGGTITFAHAFASWAFGVGWFAIPGILMNIADRVFHGPNLGGSSFRGKPLPSLNGFNFAFLPYDIIYSLVSLLFARRR